MLKISQLEPVNHAVILRLEGRVVGPWVAELQKSCEEVLAEGRPLRLHLATTEARSREVEVEISRFAGKPKLRKRQRKECETSVRKLKFLRTEGKPRLRKERRPTGSAKE